ncbi:hypothetical protein BDZ45DRAFT_178376 [Acephala macrosclerotiorum]|nr:hypothetical protein BDZ45DRAFT_178376 [Acephala macrosclerotiorum]
MSANLLKLYMCNKTSLKSISGSHLGVTCLSILVCLICIGCVLAFPRLPAPTEALSRLDRFLSACS